jgi:hypothetical protein
MTTAAVEDRPTETVNPPPLDERPVHLARCETPDCTIAVRFRASASGASFILVDADPDARFGVGEHGRPICPNGHGEMAIADDTLPAAEAFAEVQERIAHETPVQRTLPGVGPTFNFRGCYMELEQQAVLVESLRKEYEDDARVAKESKKAWDEAEERYTKMGLEFRRRRREKDGEPQDASDLAADLQRQASRPPCTWETRNAGKVCPLCSNTVVAKVVERILGIDVTPPDANAHAADVDALLAGMDVDETAEALENIDTYIDRQLIASWPAEARQMVRAYVDARLDKANNVPDVVLPERPTVLGRPHVPEAPHEGQAQRCAVCEVVVAPNTDHHPAYDVTDLIGVDCTGRAPDHRYPDKPKKKPAAAKAVAKKAKK